MQGSGDNDDASEDEDEDAAADAGDMESAAKDDSVMQIVKKSHKETHSTEVVMEIVDSDEEARRKQDNGYVKGTRSKQIPAQTRTW